jgi:hypothetical protein
MNMPPTIMKVRINGFWLWLPLFLLMPFGLVLVLVLAPFVLLAALVLWPWGYGRPLVMFLPYTLNCLHALRGLEVDVEDRKEKVHIYFK